MVGASQRILEIVLDHVKERHQFGVPIGSFQAVKHMAVDVYVAIERARALCHFAALAIAEDDDRRGLAASMAKAAAGDAQRIAAQHGIQLFGGLGYTWENDLQLYVRRAKVGELLLGGSAEHRARAARTVLAGFRSTEDVVMRLRFDDQTEAFRAEFAAWLDENAPDAADRPPSAPARPPTSRRGPATGSGSCSTPAGSCPATRPSTAAATPRCSSSSSTSRSWRGAASTPASTRRG